LHCGLSRVRQDAGKWSGLPPVARLGNEQDTRNRRLWQPEADPGQWLNPRRKREVYFYKLGFCLGDARPLFLDDWPNVPAMQAFRVRRIRANTLSPGYRISEVLLG